MTMLKSYGIQLTPPWTTVEGLVGSCCRLAAQTTDLMHLKASLNFVLVYDFVNFVFNRGEEECM
jgi:hypothetical protein